MTIHICRLCGSNEAIKGSHVTPALVYRAIKADSATGFMRLAASPNQRIQDGDKHPLLCSDCEQRFGQREAKFNKHVFKAFHQHDHDSFDYGDWLHYFLTSVTWRTLIMDLGDDATIVRIPTQVLPDFEAAADTMRRYLLGNNTLATRIDNHVFLFPSDSSCSPELAAAGPNFLIRRSVGGYTLWGDGFSAVMHNLAGFWCVTHIRLNPNDTWQNTQIAPAGGQFRPPQIVESWIAHAFFEDIIEFSKKRHNMSDKQREIIERSVQRNPNAASLRFWESNQRARDDK